jgi:glutathione S-transferase
MALTLYYHPLSSFCWKALIGLYEKAAPFTPHLVDLGDPASRDAFAKVWPLSKFPVLTDSERGETVPESTTILDYLDLHHPGGVRFTPADGHSAWPVRMWDRVLDSYVHIPMQGIVGDRLRPADQRDPFGVAQWRAQIAQTYDLLEPRLAGRTWLAGGDFSLADVSACPALFYGDKVEPISGVRPNLTAYLQRLKARPSFARVLAEAEPYFKFFPE